MPQGGRARPDLVGRARRPLVSAPEDSVEIQMEGGELRILVALGDRA